MTQKQAKEFMWLENNKNPSVIKWQHHITIRDLVEKLIDQIFSDHEAQLKALQQHKSCEGCKHYKFTYNSNDGAVRQLMTICSDCFRRLNRDNYEPKEQ